MSEIKWKYLIEASRAEADILQGFLESSSIPVNIIQEGYEHTYFGQGGAVQILVPNHNIEEARELLHSRGWKFESDEYDEADE
jgi:hypothetical protein